MSKLSSQIVLLFFSTLEVCTSVLLFLNTIWKQNFEIMKKIICKPILVLSGDESRNVNVNNAGKRNSDPLSFNIYVDHFRRVAVHCIV